MKKRILAAVLTAGMAQKPGQTRIELEKINEKITK